MPPAAVASAVAVGADVDLVDPEHPGEESRNGVPSLPVSVHVDRHRESVGVDHDVVFEQ